MRVSEGGEFGLVDVFVRFERTSEQRQGSTGVPVSPSAAGGFEGGVFGSQGGRDGPYFFGGVGMPAGERWQGRYSLHGLMVSPGGRRVRYLNL